MDIERILAHALAGGDLTPADGVALLQPRDSATLGAIRQTADILRQRQAGDTVTYVVNRNINYTNICEQHCSFCAFRRDRGDEGAYWLDFAPMVEKATEAVALGATEICMQGGLNPDAKIHGSSLNYYLKLVDTIKGSFPALHLHAFSPQEIEFIARQDGLTYRQVLLTLRDAAPGRVPAAPAGAARATEDLPSIPYDADRLASLRREGRPVFVNMTAAWCITCLFNEANALASAETRAAFAARGLKGAVGTQLSTYA